MACVFKYYTYVFSFLFMSVLYMVANFGGSEAKYVICKLCPRAKNNGSETACPITMARDSPRRDSCHVCYSSKPTGTDAMAVRTCFRLNSESDSFDQCKLLANAEGGSCCQYDKCNDRFPLLQCKQGPYGKGPVKVGDAFKAYTRDGEIAKKNSDYCRFCVISQSPDDESKFQFTCSISEDDKDGKACKREVDILKGKPETTICCKDENCNSEYNFGVKCFFCSDANKPCSEDDIKYNPKLARDYKLPGVRNSYNPSCKACYIGREGADGLAMRGCTSDPEKECNDQMYCCEGETCNLNEKKARLNQKLVVQTFLPFTCYECPSPCLKREESESGIKDNCLACLTAFYGDDDSQVSRHCVTDSSQATQYASGSLTKINGTEAWPCFWERCNSVDFNCGGGTKTDDDLSGDKILNFADKFAVSRQLVGLMILVVLACN